MKFLSVRSDICRRLPSDSTSRWTPLPLTMQFPLLGLARDFHPLDNAHAERTSSRRKTKPFSSYFRFPPASFRFQLTMDTLAFGYVIPAIRAYSGLAPVRQCSCRAYKYEASTWKSGACLYSFQHVLHIKK